MISESTSGNTAAIAEAIGRGLRTAGLEVTVAAFGAFAPAGVIDLDLLVVGAPTRDHGLARESSRETSDQEEQDIFVGTTPEPGIRDWLEDLPDGAGRAAVAFDTRGHGLKLLTGSAGKTIESKLEFGGFQIAAEHESFLVSKDDTLDEGEEARAESWAAETGGLLESLLES